MADGDVPLRLADGAVSLAGSSEVDVRPALALGATVTGGGAGEVTADGGSAWLSMWSAARDTQCPGGAQGFASPTCSSIVQTPDQFTGTLGAY